MRQGAGPRGRAAALALVLGVATGARADEGMWTFNAFPKDKVKKALGFKPDDAWLDHVRLSSVRLAGGCSGAFVSADGLVATNHHCSASCIEQLSTAKRDLMSTGFFAATQADERACPEIEINQLVSIEDVTARVQGAGAGLDADKGNAAQKAEMGRLEKACTGDDPGLRCDVVSLYQGGRYDLYRYRRWKDVRLVGAPEADVAAFGGDPDNFTFPRYDLDVSFLRVYENGKPAATPQHFKWNTAGVKDGEPVFVSGHPGTTQRLLTVAQLEYLRDVDFPARLKQMAEMRGLLTQFSRRGPEAARIAHGLLYGIENSYKRGNGQHEALLDKAIFGGKVAAEAALRAKVAKDPRRRKLYGGAWDEVSRARERMRVLRLPYGLLEQAQAFSSQLFRIARELVRLGDERGKPGDQRLREYRDSALPSLMQRVLSPAPVYADLEELTLSFSLGKLREQLGVDHPTVKKILGAQSPDELAQRLVRGSRLADVAVRKKLWDGGRAAVEASDDPMIKLARLVDADARAVRQRYEAEVEAPEKRAAELIAKARFEIEGQGAYPDATFTLRLSYGRARGYDVDGDRVPTWTTLAGAFDRATGKDPFKLPASWLAARDKIAAGTQFDFVYDCDTIGGNSGSPVVNAQAEVVGLNFDSNLHALGRAFQYDPRKGRSVAVSTAAISEALRSIYGATRLVDELAR